jgi:hypothetical protein
MKNLTTLILIVVALTLLGCEEILLEDSATTTDNNISVHNGSIPVIKSPVGSYVDLSEYLYPEELTTNKTFYFQKVYNYAQTSSNTFTEAPNLSQRSYTKAINNDVVRVTEYKDEQQQKYDDIKQYKILSYEKNKTVKEYPVRVAKNSKVLDITEDKVQEVCVVVNIGEQDLTSVLPLFVRNDLKNTLNTENGAFKSEQFNFDNIVHIYCGTSDNHTADSYYSKQYGKVLEIKKDIEKNLLKVEVVDVLSVEN